MHSPRPLIVAGTLMLALLPGCIDTFQPGWGQAKHVQPAQDPRWPLAGAWESTGGQGSRAARVILRPQGFWRMPPGLELSPGDYVVQVSATSSFCLIPPVGLTLDLIDVIQGNREISDDFILTSTGGGAGAGVWFHGVAAGPQEGPLGEFRYDVCGSYDGSRLTLVWRRIDRPPAARPDWVFNLKRVSESPSTSRR
jgi:hypothetical protein